MAAEVCAFQNWLAAHGGYAGRIDGIVGPVSLAAMTAAFRQRGKGSRVLDGRRCFDARGRVQIDIDPALWRSRFGEDLPTACAFQIGVDAQDVLWHRLAVACQSNPRAALEATLWGGWRTPGLAWVSSGFENLEAFAFAHCESAEAQQILAS